MLLATRRFLPLFLTQFLGALNDNLLKNALVILITYRIGMESGEKAQLLVTLAAGLFILPFFLFSALAGQLADKYPRERIVHLVKLAEIGIMLIAVAGFFLSHVPLLVTALFCMGTHSAFFGPLKYALLPQHLADRELLLGNALVESGTLLAILIGTILGGVGMVQEQGERIISALLAAIAVLGYISSRLIPPAPAPNPKLTIRWNLVAESWRIIRFAQRDRRVFLCILGISWFWLIGATYLSQFPGYVKYTLHAKAEVVTLFLTVFSLGIGAGSILCNRLLKGEIASTHVPLAALGMMLFGADLYFASGHAFFVPRDVMLSLGEFLGQPASWRILGDLLGISIAAGVYIVPLYTLMQHHSDPEYRARIIAANNILNAFFMVTAAVVTILMLANHFTVPQVFLICAAANGFVALFIRRLRHGKFTQAGV